jgi:hypothetical protein
MGDEIDPSEEVVAIDAEDEGDLKIEGRNASISLAKNDRSLSEFHRWFSRGRIIIDPEWQRRYVWDRKRASRLIGSFLIDLPIPVIYLALNDEGKYEVIDGLQRLTSVFDFFENKYPLTGLEIRDELNGSTFGKLTPELQASLEDKTLRTSNSRRPHPRISCSLSSSASTQAVWR